MKPTSGHPSELVNGGRGKWSWIREDITLKVADFLATTNVTKQTADTMHGTVLARTDDTAVGLSIAPAAAYFVFAQNA